MAQDTNKTIDKYYRLKDGSQEYVRFAFRLVVSRGPFALALPAEQVEIEMFAILAVPTTEYRYIAGSSAIGTRRRGFIGI